MIKLHTQSVSSILKRERSTKYRSYRVISNTLGKMVSKIWVKTNTTGVKIMQSFENYD